MKMNAKRAGHALETNPGFFEADTRKLAEAEAIEAPLATESRKPGITARLYASKESSICLVESLQGPALQTYGNGRSLRIALPPLCERPALVDVAARDAALAVGVDAFFESSVV